MPLSHKPSILLKTILRRSLTALAALLLMGAFYIAVILGQPQDSENTAVQVDMTQPLLAASPAVNIQEESQLDALAAAFPVALLRPMSGSGLDFVSGSSYDAAYEQGFARRVTLTYRTPEGLTMTVESLYPARALSLIPKGDYRLAAVAGQALAGMQSVRMENGSAIRLHAQSETGLYILTVPMMDSAHLADVTRSLQLFSQP